AKQRRGDAALSASIEDHAAAGDLRARAGGGRHGDERHAGWADRLLAVEEAPERNALAGRRTGTLRDVEDGAAANGDERVRLEVVDPRGDLRDELGRRLARRLHHDVC